MLSFHHLLTLCLTLMLDDAVAASHYDHGENWDTDETQICITYSM